MDEGWVSSRDFLLGLALIQAFPGPNFNCKHSDLTPPEAVRINCRRANPSFFRSCCVSRNACRERYKSQCRRRCTHRLHRHLFSRPIHSHGNNGPMEAPQEASIGYFLSSWCQRISSRSCVHRSIPALGDWVHRRGLSKRLSPWKGALVGCNYCDELRWGHVVQTSCACCHCSGRNNGAYLVCNCQSVSDQGANQISVYTLFIEHS